MWNPANHAHFIAPKPGTRLFSRIDPSNAVVVYSGSTLFKQPLGYYYSTRIGWDIYEVVGEIPEGIFSCIFVPDARAEVGLSGRLRFGRQGIGQVHVLDRKFVRQFYSLHAAGSEEQWIAETLDEPSGGLALIDSEIGEFFRSDRDPMIDTRNRHRTSRDRSFHRIGTFLNSPRRLGEQPAYRAALLVSLAVLLGERQFDMPCTPCASH